MNKKNILISAYSLDIGGIEKSLINLSNVLLKEGYKMTIVLEKKQGVLLDQLNKNIKVIEYTPSNHINKIIRKATNGLKRILFMFKYAKKFSVAISFATYSKAGSILARTASKNSVLWVHADYLSLYDGDKKQVKEFFEGIQYKKFKKIVFVSNESKKNFDKICKYAGNLFVINNLIDGDEIQRLANEEIQIEKNRDKYTFINVGRHDEKQKKLLRILEVTKILKEKKYNFEVLFIGDGPDTKLYEKYIEENALEEYVKLLGRKTNPYPYYQISDCVVLSSDYEGYPVVLLESYILNKPIITTKVSDYEEVEEGHGIVTQKNVTDICCAMERMINNKNIKVKEFDYKLYNQEILKNINKTIGKE